MKPVVIVGGGIAGAAAAIALRIAGVPCVVLERTRPLVRRLAIGECLASAARVPLSRLGLWDEFVAQAPPPSHANVSLWGGPDHAHDLLGAPHGEGWQIDRHAFEAWLLAAAQRHGATVQRGTTVTSCDRAGDRMVLGVKDGSRHDTIEADLVIDATGPSALVARQQGALRLDHDRMMAWAVRLRPDARESDPVASRIVEPVADGWWYAAPVPDGDLVVVFVTGDVARPMDLDTWRARLAATGAIGPRCAGRQPIGAPTPVKVVVGRLDRFCGPGWLAVGDAALSRDPLDDVGIACALASGLAAAEAISRDDVATYGRELHHAFEAHLGRRAACYRAEHRWARSDFWARRAVVLDEPITLQPTTRLELARPLPRDVPRELGTQLCAHEWRRLGTVAGPQPAAELARRLAPATDQHAGDRRLVAALQAMVRSGALRAV